MTVVVGRDVERRRLEDLVSAATSGLRSLTLIGPAGIGKSSLLEWAVDRAEAGGCEVWRARACASEVTLPWVVLTDLLRTCGPDALSALPPPQRLALEVATLRVEAGAVIADGRAVSMALLALVELRSEVAPVVIAIDDEQWVDPATAAALRFVFRRLRPATRCLVLTATRGEGSDRVVTGAFVPDIGLVHTIGGLSVAAMYRLLQQRLGVALPRPTIVRIHATAAGNPLYGIELALALQRDEIDLRPGRPLPLTVGLRALVWDRVAQLSSGARLITAATAATWRLAVAGLPPAELAEALGHDVVVVEDDILRPRHPLVAEAAYQGLSDEERRGLHRWLAEASRDVVERARHLALSSPLPDADVAAALDRAAGVLVERGALLAAAELASLAVDHTGLDDELRVVRLGRLGDLLFRVGDVGRAVEVLQLARDVLPEGPAQACMRVRVAEVLFETHGVLPAIAELEAALPAADGYPAVLAEVHLTLGAIHYDDVGAADRHARIALALLESIPDPDPALLAGALSNAAGAQFRAGRGVDHDAHQRAIELELAFPSRRLSDRADAGYAAVLKYADELDDAERRFDALEAEASASGDLSSLAYVYAHRSQIPLWRGDLATAHRMAEAHLALAEETEMADQRAQALYLLGLVAAFQGDAAEASALLGEALADADRADEDWGRQRAHGALGFLALSLRDLPGALKHLSRWHQLSTAVGLREPGQSRYHGDYAAVLVESGMLAEADTFLDQLEDAAQRSGRVSAAAYAAVGRALVSSARGDSASAIASAQEALVVYDRLPLRFDRARALLVAGRIQRRAKSKLVARQLIEEACSEFDHFGAALWSAQARSELARINIRAAAPLNLTETERRVAELAARGMTNRQVGEALFLAPKTVEANLGRVYRKLAISSRAELGALMGKDSAR